MIEKKEPLCCEHDGAVGSDSDLPRPVGRRRFLGQAGGALTAAVAAIGLERAAVPGKFGHANQQAPPPVSPAVQPGIARRNQSYQIRHQAALYNKHLSIPQHPSNGDESLYSSKIASYSKGLPHNGLGEVDPGAYASLKNALNKKTPHHFENIILGDGWAKLTNPQSGLAFDLEGTDSHQFAIPPAPRFASAEEAGEMVELYWMALLRDVNFLDYDGHPLAEAAAADLSSLSDFRGPKVAGQVTTGTLFRDPLPGATVGPYISQFLWMPTPFGAERVDRKMRTLLPGSDQMTAYPEWLAIQNGAQPTGLDQWDPVTCHLRNGRDLGQWVHIDVLFQAYFNAMLILLQPPDPSDPFTGGGMGVPLNPGNPYHGSSTQIGFASFGGPHIATMVCEVATRALKAQWFQKWFVHRRLRPEVFAARVHNHVTNATSYPIHADVLGSEALARIHDAHGTSLLPMVFPEGSPTHPSYGAGHATVAGACVTVLKALFDESYAFPDPVVPSGDGQSLVPYTGPALSVGGELNKLASNVATGRNVAGVHWRTDALESLKLGEAVAISVLRDQAATYNEEFDGFTFTTFDGTTVTVGAATAANDDDDEESEDEDD